MTDRVEEIRARAEAATPGEWTVWENSAGVGVTFKPGNPLSMNETICSRKEDCEFIAHARSDIPYLLSLIVAERNSRSKKG